MVACGAVLSDLTLIRQKMRRGGTVRARKKTMKEENYYLAKQAKNVYIFRFTPGKLECLTHSHKEVLDRRLGELGYNKGHALLDYRADTFRSLHHLHFKGKLLIHMFFYMIYVLAEVITKGGHDN